MFFSFNSTFRFAILRCFNPAETFHFASVMFVHIRVPPNNPIYEQAPSLGSTGYHYLSKWAIQRLI